MWGVWRVPQHYSFHSKSTSSCDGNQRLTGYLPEFQNGSLLKVLSLPKTSFSGSIPLLIEKLEHLNYLDVGNSNLSGLIPSSLGKLTKVTDLWLESNNFCDQIPSSLRNLTNFIALHLSANQLSGQLPSWLANLTQLTELELTDNYLTGVVPPSFSRLRNLEILYLCFNELSGTLDFDMFLGMKSLLGLQLQGNNLYVLTRTINTPNATTPKFEYLFLDDCNLSTFPNFLRYQDNLINLGLSGNHLSGQIPKWL